MLQTRRSGPAQGRPDTITDAQGAVTEGCHASVTGVTDADALAELDEVGLAGLSRLILALDDNGVVVVDVLRTRTGLIWAAEELAAVLLAAWVAHLLVENPALDAYLQGLLAETAYIRVADKAVAGALLTAAQAAAGV